MMSRTLRPAHPTPAVDTRVADLVRRSVTEQVPVTASGANPWIAGPTTAEIGLFDLSLVLG
jgi:hypothetical protein